MVFPTFFNSSLNFAIRRSQSEPQSWSYFCWLYRTSPSLDANNKQSGFGINHLVMSTCKVFSCVVGRGCLLWPLHSLGKTPLAFALLHPVLQGQICLLLQVFLDFLLLHLVPYSGTKEKTLHMDITWWSILKTDWLYSLQPKKEKLSTVTKTRLGADWGSDHELLIAKFRLELVKGGKTSRPFRYDLNQIPYG